MKKIIYTCDKCGKEINGAPIKLVPCSYDAYGDVTEIEPDDLGGKVLKLQRCDYCEKCFEDICYRILAETEDDQPVKEGRSVKGDKSKKGGKSTMDAGKIKELFLAGWKVTEIADKMHCSPPAVYRYLRIMREQGEIA